MNQQLPPWKKAGCTLLPPTGGQGVVKQHERGPGQRFQALRWESVHAIFWFCRCLFRVTLDPCPLWAKWHDTLMPQI